MSNFENNGKSLSTRFFDVIWLGVAFMILYLGLAFMRPLAGPDEGRYAEIPREMAVSGDWVTPRLNGMQYFYKPPFMYWVNAASIKALGINRVSVRLPNSAAAVLGILLTYLAVSALSGRKAAIASAVVLGTSLLYFALGEIVTLDMTVSVFIAASLFSFIVALKRTGVWRGFFILGFFLFCALAVLTKGLIGILIPCAVVFIFACLFGIPSFLALLKKSDILWILAGIVVFLGVSIPWHVFAAIANPPYESAEGIFSKNWEGQGFFWYYIIHEHFLRYIDADTSMRFQPFWFFLVLAPVGFLPWLVALPQAVCEPFKHGWGEMRRNSPETLFFIVWVVFVVGFFSISKSKLAPYIVPIYPALAAIVGAYAGKIWENPARYKLEFIKWSVAFLGLVLVVAPIILWFILPEKAKWFEPAYAAFMLGGELVFMLACLLSIIYFIRSHQTQKFMITAAFATFGFLMFFNPLAVFFQRPSSEEFVAKINQLRQPGDTVAIAYDYGSFQDFPVWLNELPVVIGTPPEEQKFGYMREREIHKSRFLPTWNDFGEMLLKKGGAAFVVMTDSVPAPKFDNPKLRVEELDRNGKTILLKIYVR